MIILAVIFGFCAFVVGVFAFSRFPRDVMIMSFLVGLVGAAIIGFLYFGPKNYMLRVPESLQTALHPWTLALCGVLFTVVGIGGILGSCIHHLMRRAPACESRASRKDQA